MINTYLRYGIPNDLAEKLVLLEISKTALENTTQKNLQKLFRLSNDEIQLVKELIQRKPIDAEVVESLLENSNYTCCMCKGIKGKSFIIHHIKEYSISQDNSYENLAVLCPDDHDSAHKTGKTLSQKITGQQIINAKKRWEKYLNDKRIEKASRNGNISEIDFLNISRILELYVGIFLDIPITKYSAELYDRKLITEAGILNATTINKLNDHPATPLIFYGPYGSTMLKFHFYEAFQKLLNYLNFVDLDTLLNKSSIKAGITGKYCFYAGGLYSKKVSDKISRGKGFLKFRLQRKPFIAEWLIDPQYFCSVSAQIRAVERGTYMIFGKIRNVNIHKIEDTEQIIIDIRPYCFGLPELQKDRTPEIAQQRRLNDIFDDDNSI